MVYNDLKQSVYHYKYDKLDFYFSSYFYLEKFKKLAVNYIKDETTKLNIKFKCNMVCDEMLLISLYKKIEKRGYRVLYNGKELKEKCYITININYFSYRE